MTVRLKLLSGALTVALLAGAVLIGGGVPPSPGEIARSTSRAADNVKEAVDNTRTAVQSTQSLRRIADSVHDQVEASHRLLDIQLEIEGSSRAGARESVAVERSVASIRATLARLEAGIAALTELSSKTGDHAASSAEDAKALVDALDVLQAKFDVVVAQSRKLDRKARGYRKLKGGP